MGKTITIPTNYNPYIVVINNHVYIYSAGETVEVPEEVAKVIEDSLDLAPKYDENSGGNAEGGIIPSGTLSITANGEYNVYNYSSAVVNVPTSGGSGSSILPQIIDRSIGAITKDDLAGVTKIGEYAFAGCHNLFDEVQLPNGVTRIGQYAFLSCTEVGSFIIPDSVTRIDSRAFSSCTMLYNIVIGRGITYLGTKIFNDCDQSVSMTILAETPPTLATDALNNNYGEGCTCLTDIYVPAASVDAYKSASGWSEYADIIKAM